MSDNIINDARAQQPSLHINDGTSVELNDKNRGLLLGNRVIVFCPPTHGQKGSLESAYEKIFSLFEQNAKSDETLLVPCFSTDKGGIDIKTAAKTAVAAAKAYLTEHSDRKITFVTYTDARGQENYRAYEAEIKAISDENIKAHMSVEEGDIAQMNGEARVLPIQENYDLQISGPTAKAIAKVASEKITGEPQKKHDTTFSKIEGEYSPKDLSDDDKYISDEDL